MVLSEVKSHTCLSSLKHPLVTFRLIVSSLQFVVLMNIVFYVTASSVVVDIYNSTPLNQHKQKAIHGCANLSLYTFSSFLVVNEIFQYHDNHWCIKQTFLWPLTYEFCNVHFQVCLPVLSVCIGPNLDLIELVNEYFE